MPFSSSEVGSPLDTGNTFIEIRSWKYQKPLLRDSGEFLVPGRLKLNGQGQVVQRFQSSKLATRSLGSLSCSNRRITSFQARLNCSGALAPEGDVGHRCVVWQCPDRSFAGVWVSFVAEMSDGSFIATLQQSRVHKCSTQDCDAMSISKANYTPTSGRYAVHDNNGSND